MGVFMEDRLLGVAAWCIFGRCLSGAAPMVSKAVLAIALAKSGLYAFLLVKTLQAVVLVPMVWRAVSKLLVSRDLTPEEFFRVDAPPEDVAARREAGFRRLEAAWRERWPKARETSRYLLGHFSDFRFKASGFESTFPIFQKVVNEALDPATIVEKSEGNELVDVEGHRFLDASGSYGVNCFGFTRFKEFMRKGHELSQQLGPCLGPMHPIVAENIEMLLRIFRKEEVSFHMSGTEAVMCAVQQARFHTRRPLIAVFKGAYHGWWDGVMQGAGNERFNSDTLILKDQDSASLELLRIRRGEIAAVIVNPISGFGWGNAPTSKLGHAEVKAGPAAMERFKGWLHQLRDACSKNRIPLIFDETWAFQLGPGGAQELYGVEADIIVLGKSLGGGHATGAVLGPSRLMERRDPDRPMRVSFVVGTFKGNPVVMGAMNAVLKWVSSSEAVPVFNGLKERVAAWVESCNATLAKEKLPISVAAHRSTWCICYHQPSPYQFMFQYYLRDAGLQMAWVGTGKMLLNLEYSEKDLERLTGIILSAARAFREDGWWFAGGKPVKLAGLVVGPTLQYHFRSLLRSLGLSGTPATSW
mmetsp:Transcript_65789/g.132114  ORF Transcript_65789/g.132114 Transcript_65789/m.132114 type:complete len:585 (+) Transcript_65789:93-1847(+)